MADPTSELTVYVWPGKWNLPSIQPESLAVLFALQLTIPGKFAVKYCSNPDLSPTGERGRLGSCSARLNQSLGQLPCIDNDGIYISTIQSIFNYINQLGPHNVLLEEDEQIPSGLDAFLTLKQASQKAAWVAYTHAHLGDLVVCISLFSYSIQY